MILVILKRLKVINHFILAIVFYNDAITIPSISCIHFFNLFNCTWYRRVYSCWNKSIRIPNNLANFNRIALRHNRWAWRSNVLWHRYVGNLWTWHPLNCDFFCQSFVFVHVNSTYGKSEISWTHKTSPLIWHKPIFLPFVIIITLNFIKVHYSTEKIQFGKSLSFFKNSHSWQVDFDTSYQNHLH